MQAIQGDGSLVISRFRCTIEERVILRKMSKGNEESTVMPMTE